MTTLDGLEAACPAVRTHPVALEAAASPSQASIVRVTYPESVDVILTYLDGRECAWLDGWSVDGSTAAYSLICVDPVLTLSTAADSDESADSPGISGPGHTRTQSHAQHTTFERWRELRVRQPMVSPLPFPLGPGWVGYVGFEVIREFERIRAGGKRPGPPLPLARLGFFPEGIVLDHQARAAYAVGLEPLRPAWIERWEAACRAPRTPPAAPRFDARPGLSRDAYRAMIRRALDYIAAGDVYQANLAQHFTLCPHMTSEGRNPELAAVAADVYAVLRATNPAPYGGLLRWPGGALASVSPELLLSLQDGFVRTRPIKGTRPRTHDPRTDERQRRDLLSSPKEAAELAMIVDLHRNDLGRVCATGTVRVEQARRLEAHPTVYHTVADITGRLAASADELDLLQACLPAGSVSGVPKIRAVEIIAELEPVARGAYCGAMGVLSLDGRMLWNVAIRTLQITPQAATLYVGGGIVAESDPEQEYEECLAKGRGILRALGCADPAEWA